MLVRRPLPALYSASNPDCSATEISLDATPRVVGPDGTGSDRTGPYEAVR
jgi:hypothetical protein